MSYTGTKLWLSPSTSPLSVMTMPGMAQNYMERKVLAEAEIKQMVYSFNPRSHTGSDPFRIAVSSILGVSIHAPTRGATAVNFIT